MNRAYIVLLGTLAAAGTAPTLGQPRPTAIASSDVLSQISIFSYNEGPKSDLLFRGTPIAATAQGKATIEYQDGNTSIAAKVEKLPPPASLGPYTTYVLWAVTPEGRAANQGVISGSEGGKGELETRYPASQFALIVTAEPHFAVTVPSTMIALYNVADDVKGQESKITTLTGSADYSRLARLAIDEDQAPAELVQARYAVAIADAAGAKEFAPQQYAAANQKLAAATSSLGGKKKEREAGADSAREAVIAAEDARRSAEEAAAQKATADAQREQTELETAAAAVLVAREGLFSRTESRLPAELVRRRCTATLYTSYSKRR